MKITDAQEQILKTLRCERLSSDRDNLRRVETFCNHKNGRIAETLLNEAYEEDEKGTIAYYLVKNQQGDILFFFSLKCGLLFDEFIEGERLREFHAFYDCLVKIRNSDKVSEEEKRTIDSLLEDVRAKKGVKRAELAKAMHVSKETKYLESLFSGGLKNVGRTFPGIEIVHLCANDNCREDWNRYGFDQKMGTVIFWYFIIPIVQEAMKHVGCEYLFLFAADMSVDEELVNYYRTNLNFQDGTEHSVAIPLYDFGCKFMYQETGELAVARERFFASFNRDKEAV